ncbi:YqiJ family protein [Dactylosporangium aurantiacum]|uniref:YqiJ family protein n=1 Tax=Dactylosporangium aurantiacum TaxID=35754 RepID=UPI001FE1CE4A|nr:YqiJ family protein [Dactylosporangium aurantiacum]MDG6103862.1 YqiJ family protein [Dactylosporangium aurantiacum]
MHNLDRTRHDARERAAGGGWGVAVRGQSLVGRVGVVVTAVRGGDRPGEIRIVVQGVPHHYLAYAAEPVPSGTHVLVVHFRGARQVDVEPWSPMPGDHTTTG